MKTEEDQSICYVAIDDKGDMRGACVHDDERPERTAAWIATFIVEGLHVMPASAEDVREGFGRQTEGPDMKPAPAFHVRVAVKRGSTIYEECEGDDSLGPKGLNFISDPDFDDPISDTDGQDAEQARFVLRQLGVSDYQHVRTLGDVDALRAQLAGGAL